MNDRTDAEAAWTMAIAKISDATNNPPETIQPFLDSCHGRHFADSVLNHFHYTGNLADAIDAAITQWMNWKIGRITARDFGIPKGMPYLTGFVIHCEIIGTEQAA